MGLTLLRKLPLSTRASAVRGGEWAPYMATRKGQGFGMK